MCNYAGVQNSPEPINVGGVNLFSVRGADASKRAQIFYERLSNALMPGLKESDIQVKVVNKENVIFVKDVMLMTITDLDAKENKCSKLFLTNKIYKILLEKLPSLAPVEPKYD